jgi:hypothetical protein
MEHEHRAAKIRCTEETSRPLSMKRRYAVGLLSALVTTCLFAGTMGAQDLKPNPPYDPAKVTIANEPPFFLSDRSIENPYSDPLYNPKTAGGLLSPLIFTHTTAVHGGLLWKKGAKAPKLLLSHRHSEFRGNDVADPDVLDQLINWTAADSTSSLPLGVTSPPKFTFTDGSGQAVSVFGAFNDPRSNFTGAIRQSYAWAMYGGFSIQGHGRTVARRIEFDRGVEDAQLWDLGHPDAFKNSGKYDVATLTDGDALLNKAAFKDSGYSKGLRGNLYCYGGTTLADGSLVGVGGNDMNSSNGLYRVNRFNQETETWTPRAEGCHRAGWSEAPASDPFFKALFAPLYEAFFNDPTNPAKKDALYFMDGCKPIAGGATVTVTQENGFPFKRYVGPTATQPADPSDMKYARWYPAVLQLPDNTVLIMAGQDQNESVGTHQPVNPTTGKLNVDPVSGYPRTLGTDRVDAEFADSMIFQTVPELYNPKTDRTTAMESAARVVMPNYPHLFAVQTGPGKKDWKVVMFPGTLLSSVGGNQSYEGPHGGGTWLFDVQGAMADPNRDIPGAEHVTFVDHANGDHQNYGMAAEVLELGKDGRTISHKVMAFGGLAADSGAITNTVEMIDFAKPQPWKWELQQPLYQPASATKAIPLPDGTILIGGGSAPGDTLEQRSSLHFQLFNPADGTMKKLPVKTTVPKSSHGNLYLLPDATAMLTGDDHTNSVPVGDRVAPFGDPDLGVDTAQIFKPAYLFNDDGTEAARPAIKHAPDEIHYGDDFNISVEMADGKRGEDKRGEGRRIQMVTLFHSGSSTHSNAANIRLIKLAFKGEGRELKVIAPRLPVQAVPGDYTLFVVDDRGVPSVAKHVRIVMDDDDKRGKRDHDR